MNELETQQDADFDRILKNSGLTGEKIIGDGRPMILTDLESTIVYIKLPGTEVFKPYTRTDIPEINITYDKENELYFDETHFGCLDILSKKYVKIAFDDAEEQMFFNDHQRGIEEYNKHLDAIAVAKSKCPDIDEQVIIDTRFKLNKHTEIPAVWEIHYMTDFKFNDLSEIWNREYTESEMVELRDWYMNKIRAERETAFVELDQLEADARAADASEQDLTDIDTIKQMFRDIPQTVDLDIFKTVPDMLSFWPSLLVNTSCPKLEIVRPHFVTPSEDEYIESLLVNIDDIEELEKLRDEINENPSSNGEHARLIQNRIKVLQARK